jgi:hypothetical protein
MEWRHPSQLLVRDDFWRERPGEGGSRTVYCRFMRLLIRREGACCFHHYLLANFEDARANAVASADHDDRH